MNDDIQITSLMTAKAKLANSDCPLESIPDDCNLSID